MPIARINPSAPQNAIESGIWVSFIQNRLVLRLLEDEHHPSSVSERSISLALSSESATPPYPNGPLTPVG
jgi:hypothetical protein